VDAWIWWFVVLFYNLCNLVATLHESHINHSLARPQYSCSCYSQYTLRVDIRIFTRRSLASNWSSVDEDLRAQVKARRVSQRAQTWRAPARARVMWTHLNETRTRSSTSVCLLCSHLPRWLNLTWVSWTDCSRWMLTANYCLITALDWTRLLVAYSLLLWSLHASGLTPGFSTLTDWMSKSTLLSRSSGLVRYHPVQGFSFPQLLMLLSREYLS
jgi:hypothetical protein